MVFTARQDLICWAELYASAESMAQRCALCVQISERAETDVFAFAMPRSLWGLARGLASDL